MKTEVRCFFAVALFACGGSDHPPLSQLNYRVASPQFAGITRIVANPVIRVCYRDSSNSIRHREDVVFSILEWIRPLRGLDNVAQATEVEFVGPSDLCDAAVNVGNYSPAYTQMGRNPSIQINYSGWFGSKSVTLHEFGHAFGLLDTYAGSGGSCQSGQPDSVMCRASYEELQTDDEAGVLDVFAQATAATENSGFEPTDETLTVY